MILFYITGKERKMRNFFVGSGAVLLAILVGVIMLSLFFITVGSLLTIEEQHNNFYLLIVAIFSGCGIAMAMIASGAWFYERYEERWWVN